MLGLGAAPPLWGKTAAGPFWEEDFVCRKFPQDAVVSLLLLP